jgi:isocitrate/isopropylmalate dehydrogenase
MIKTYKIAISPGDGVGHEVIGWAQKALETLAEIDGGFSFDFRNFEIGAELFRRTGEAISRESLDAMREADATIFVAIAAAEIPRHHPNPIATLLSAKLMLGYLGEQEAGDRMQRAIERVIERGETLTPDMGGTSSTDEIGEAIIGALKGETLHVEES